MEFEPVIGLEIHVQLNTRTKIFSSAPNRFGDEPNTNVSFADTAQPGALPVLNREAVNKAILFGLAVDADIAHFSKFDRKSYFYPDSPKNYQITQFYDPIMHRGSVSADVEGEMKTFTLHHAHLEDDAGMLKHFSSFAGVDYNRAGVPLLEIVSDPCMHSAAEATAFAMAVKAIMEYIGASECNMEEGGLRMDVNVSLRPKGSSELRNKAEIKNMNSFTNMQLAIASEIRRQTNIYKENKTVENETLRFDLEKRITIPMRSKEMAADYRYFPEPDLPPIILTKEEIEKIRANLPELPQERLERYLTKLSLSPYNATLLVNEKKLSDYFEDALLTSNDPIVLCNWITVEFVGRLKDSGESLLSKGIEAKHVAELVNMIGEKTITGKIAKSIADIMVKNPGKSPKKIVKENPDFQPMTDISAIEKIVHDVVDANPQSAVDYKNGNLRSFNFLIGQIMKATRGKAEPTLVRDLLKKKLQ